MTKLCHCGKPEHYASEAQEKLVQDTIKVKGEFAYVTQLETDRRFKVPWGYIIVHGVKGNLLHTYGFEEVPL